MEQLPTVCMCRSCLGLQSIAWQLGMLGCEYRKLMSLHRLIWQDHVTEYMLQLPELHDTTLHLASQPILSLGGWIVAEATIVCSTGLLVTGWRESDPNLEYAELAQLSVHTALNCLPIMRRKYGMPGISSMHEEDAEGEFAKDSHEFKRECRMPSKLYRIPSC